MADYLIEPMKANLLKSINEDGVKAEADAIQLYYGLIAQAEFFINQRQMEIDYGDGSMPGPDVAKQNAARADIAKVQDLINTLAQDIIPDEKDHLEKLRAHDDAISMILRGA